MSKQQCTICGNPQTGLNTVVGAGICDTCVSDGPRRSLRSVRRLGTLDWETGGSFWKPGWLTAQGQLGDGADSGIDAVFSGRGSTDVKTGDAQFDSRVSTRTTSVDATSRFLEDAGARQAIAHVVNNIGKVTINGSGLQVSLRCQFMTSTKVAAPIVNDGLWAIGILFSRMASVSGTPAQASAPVEQGGYLTIRENDRAEWLRRYADGVAQWLGGQVQGEDFEIALEVDATFRNRNVHVELDTDSGTVELSLEVRGVPHEIGLGIDGPRSLLGSLHMVDLGNQMWAWAFHPHGPDEARATIDAMGPDRLQSFTQLMQSRHIHTFEVTSDKFNVALQRTAPEVPPEELAKLVQELAELAATMESP